MRWPLTKLHQIMFLRREHLLPGLCIIFSISFTLRLTHAMDFTVTNSHLVLTRSQKCGLRIGVDGKWVLSWFITSSCLNLVLFPWICIDSLYQHSASNFSSMEIDFLLVLVPFDLYGTLGFSRSVVLHPTDLWKTLHLLWLAFSSLEELSRITIWYFHYIQFYIIFMSIFWCL